MNRQKNMQDNSYLLLVFICIYFILSGIMGVEVRNSVSKKDNIENNEIVVVSVDSLREIEVEKELKLTEDIVVYSEDGNRYHELHLRDVSRNTMYISVVSESKVNRLKDELIKGSKYKCTFTYLYPFDTLSVYSTKTEEQEKEKDIAEKVKNGSLYGAMCKMDFIYSEGLNFICNKESAKENLEKHYNIKFE